MHPVKLLENTAGRAVHAVRHPIASAAYAAGVVRGIAGVGARVVTGHHDRTEPTSGPTSRTAPHAAEPAQPSPKPTAPPTAPRTAPPTATEPDDVRAPEPTPLHESFATEPTATSRDSAHGRSGADADIDAWAEEAADFDDDVDIETPVGTTGAGVGSNPDTAEADLQQPGTEPLIDPGTAKAIRSEAETLQKAADPDKG
jgi:hypothetical protein